MFQENGTEIFPSPTTTPSQAIPLILAQPLIRHRRNPRRSNTGTRAESSVSYISEENTREHSNHSKQNVTLNSFSKRSKVEIAASSSSSGLLDQLSRITHRGRLSHSQPFEFYKKNIKPVDYTSSIVTDATKSLSFRSSDSNSSSSSDESVESVIELLNPTWDTNGQFCTKSIATGISPGNYCPTFIRHPSKRLTGRNESLEDPKKQLVNQGLYLAIWWRIIIRLSLGAIAVVFPCTLAILSLFFTSNDTLYTIQNDKEIHVRELASDVVIDSTINFQTILKHLVEYPFNYFIFLWIILAIPLGFGFCCWLCAQRNYQRLVSVSP